MPEKNVVQLTILPSLARGGATADPLSPDIQNDHFRGAEIILHQTAQSSSQAFPTLTVQGKIPGTTSYYKIGTLAPATAATYTKRLVIYPGRTTALDSTALSTGAITQINDFLPPVWRVKSTHAGTSTAATVTYSVTANLYA